MKMTMRKIAELAGVSRSAVDKVIHGRAGVRPEIRERVQQIIAETGYVPIHERKTAELEANREQTICQEDITRKKWTVMGSYIDLQRFRQRQTCLRTVLLACTMD